MATDTPTRERALPSNLEAERTVLGAVLVDNAAFNSAAEILSREDFYRDAHRRIFEAMASLAERSQPIDLVTLKDELTRRNALEAVGGAEPLSMWMGWACRESLQPGLPKELFQGSLFQPLMSLERWSLFVWTRRDQSQRKLGFAGNQPGLPSDSLVRKQDRGPGRDRK